MTKLNARFCSVATALAALAVFSFSPMTVQAQSQGIIVKIPFDFYVGAQKLPPGEYRITHLTDPAVLRIYDGNGHVAVTFTNGVDNNSEGHLGQAVFNRYGEEYFLSEVRWMGSPVGRQLMKSSLETQIARNSKSDRVITATNK